MTEPVVGFHFELGDLSPNTEEEVQAAAAAVAHERDAALTMAAWTGLSDFERLLAEEAYEAGQREVIEAVRKAIGPAATQLDPAALLALISPHRGELDFGSPLAPDTGWRSPQRVRAGALVRRARRLAEVRGKTGP